MLTLCWLFNEGLFWEELHGTRSQAPVCLHWASYYSAALPLGSNLFYSTEDLMIILQLPPLRSACLLCWKKKKNENAVWFAANKHMLSCCSPKQLHGNILMLTKPPRWEFRVFSLTPQTFGSVHPRRGSSLNQTPTAPCLTLYNSSAVLTWDLYAST